MDEIYNQLEEYCDCLQDIDNDEFRKNVNEVINIISYLTCWTQKPCDTFLRGERQEKFEIDNIDLCGCARGIKEYSLAFQPLYKDTIKLTLIINNGIDYEYIEIDDSYYSYNEYFKVLKVNLSEFVKNSKCRCKDILMLVVDYEAGYELIPDCLLQLFCDVLQNVNTKNECSCGHCSVCGIDDTDDGTIIIPTKFNSTLNRTISNYIDDLVSGYYSNALSLISICNNFEYYCNDNWSVKV